MFIMHTVYSDGERMPLSVGTRIMRYKSVPYRFQPEIILVAGTELVKTGEGLMMVGRVAVALEYFQVQVERVLRGDNKPKKS